MVLLMIAGLPLVVVLVATWLWYYVASGKLDLVAMLGTANRGELLATPVDIRSLALKDVSGKPFDPVAGEKPLWRILIPGSHACDEPCRNMLHFTRQVHTAMGKHRNRIERIYAFAPGDKAEARTVAMDQYPKLQVLYTSAAALAQELDIRAGDSSSPAYYVVDPRGWIILAYGADADGKDVMADLKFLLKNSSG